MVELNRSYDDEKVDYMLTDDTVFWVLFWWVYMITFLCKAVTPPDTTAPTISGCPTNAITVTTGSQSNFATAFWTEPTATDDSGVAPTRSRSHAPGSSFPVGTTVVTYRFTDGSGNSDVCSFQVIVSSKYKGLFGIWVENIFLYPCTPKYLSQKSGMQFSGNCARNFEGSGNFTLYKRIGKCCFQESFKAFEEIFDHSDLHLWKIKCLTFIFFSKFSFQCWVSRVVVCTTSLAIPPKGWQS